MDRYGHPIALSFDLVRGESPLIIGLDVTQYANIINSETPRYISIKRPTDSRTLALFTYITTEGSDGKTQRLRLEISPHKHSSITSLMENISMLGKRTPLAFSKKIHRFTHANADEIKHICKNAGILDKELSRASDVVDSECEICARNGRPASMRKVSLTHVNSAFNQEIQIDFTHCDIRGTRYTLINMTDRGTVWTEMCIVEKQNIDTMKSSVKRYWICVHGAPGALFADDAYDKPNFHTFLKQHNIVYKPRPARRHNKLGCVERKNRTVKAIIRKLDNEITDADAETIVARAVFLSNLFSGSRKLNSFQLAKGYTPPILGIPSSRVTTELLQAHKEQAATRAMQTLLHSKNPTVLPSNILQPGVPVWVYYETSSKTKKKEWVKASVVNAEQHRVLARRSKKGPPMRVAYEDIRVAPNSQLTQDLMSQTVEEALAADDSDSIAADDSDSIEADDSNSSQEHAEAMHDQGTEDVLSDRGVGSSNGDEALHSMSDTPTSSVLLANNQNPSVENAGTDSDSDNQAVAEENPEADIGIASTTKRPPPNATLSSDRARVMEDIAKTIGKEQVTRSRLESAPSWIVEEAFEKEHSSNWADAYNKVDDSSVPPNANVISSHTINKVKTSEDGTQTLKARIVPHGNRDRQKDNIRKDSSTAQFDVIRILLTAVTFIGMRLALADIKGAYLQSGPIQREIYVRPPREWKGSRGKLWRLTKLPYGIVEAGRQWAKTVEE